MINWLKLGWAALRFGWDQRRGIKDAVEGLVDGEPEVKGTPLSHKDVDHIQEQIRSATEQKVCFSCEFATPFTRCPSCLRLKT